MTADSEALALHREMDSLRGAGTNSPGGFIYATHPHRALAVAGAAFYSHSGVIARTTVHQRKFCSARVAGLCAAHVPRAEFDVDSRLLGL
jgi:hypothetical protein